MRRGTLLAGGAALALGARAAQLAAQSLPTVRVLYEPIDTATAIFAAREMGFFKQAGIDVELQPMNTGAAMMAAAVSGAVDIVLPNVLSIAEAYAQGVPIRVVALNVVYDAKNPSTSMLVLNDSALTSARDVNGKTIAVNVLNGLAWIAARAWIDANGGDSRTVRFVEMPFGTMPEALTARRVDAAVVAEPALGIAKRDARVLGQVYSAIAPSFPIDSWVASTAWLGANLDAAKRFNAAMRQACAYANHNRDKTAEIAAGFMNLDAAVIRGRVRATFAETRGFGAAQVVLDQGVKYGVLKNPVATSSLTMPQLAV